jgi:proteic killer suppression protein
MEISFRTSKLKKQYENHRLAERAYGAQVARRYIQRINIIKKARDIGELCDPAMSPGLRCHPLKADREGQWAVNLTGFYRLIFTLQGEQLEVACIEEVSKHYDD